MNENNPHSEPEFEQFLKGKGLAMEGRLGPEGQPFGNWIIQYGNADLRVSMVLDRSQRSVTIADKNTPLSHAIFPASPVDYHVPSIRESLFGIPASPMAFEDQKEFVRAHWDAIVAMFSSESRQATHERLALQGRERLKRTLKPWPPVIVDFENFLKSKGCECDMREAPDGALGERIMLYHNDVLNVKVASEGGWQLTFAERGTRPDTWYHLSAIRRLLLGDIETKFPFTEWFLFASTNWNLITALFTPDRREESHRQLQPLEAEARRRRQLAREQQAAQLEEFAKRARQRPTQ
jgi:hypothetical protein